MPRKKLPALEKITQLTVYVKKAVIEANGGDEACKQKCMRVLNRSAKVKLFKRHARKTYSE